MFLTSTLSKGAEVKSNEIYMYYKKKITSDNYMYIMSSFVESVFREYPLMTILDVNRLIHITFQLKSDFDEQFPLFNPNLFSNTPSIIQTEQADIDGRDDLLSSFFKTYNNLKKLLI